MMIAAIAIITEPKTKALRKDLTNSRRSVRKGLEELELSIRSSPPVASRIVAKQLQPVASQNEQLIAQEPNKQQQQEGDKEPYVMSLPLPLQLQYVKALVV